MQKPSIDAIDIVALARALALALAHPLDTASSELSEAELLASRLERGDSSTLVLRSARAARHAIDHARVAAHLLGAVGPTHERSRSVTELGSVLADAVIIVEAGLGPTVKIEVDERESASILADAPRLCRLVVRLLRRALDMTDAGSRVPPGTLVRASVFADGEHAAVLEIRARRLAQGPPRHEGIAHLDLILCRALARLEDGLLQVSEEGQDYVASLRFATAVPTTAIDSRDAPTQRPEGPGQ